MKEKEEKIKVSKEQFAEALYIWFLKCFNEKAIKETAKDLELKIKNDIDYLKIYKELFFLNMWIVVRACENEFEDENKRDECLDIFHHFVCERFIPGITNFKNWMKSLGEKYAEYDKAMETEHPLTPTYVLAKLINKNIFGELKKSISPQMTISTKIVFSIKHLRKAIRQFDIK